MPDFDPNHYVDPTSGVLQVRSGTPGVSGAIGDAVKALAMMLAPKALTQRTQRVNQAVDEASNAPNATPLGNQF